ncbi:MAG: type IX secretion system protein PorQ [Candidatus Pseudobacter hemicellulosilyticus]|uniref:Type IX secretion system protein PorQ n=1 Tax=Candidatus Pseudobacter hemicellulosilyticus TaxID=3121375 RepID=A0AAJ5WU01_9BACT|nr:MAG: type IX secretion system protein PorQ [Pseudobacter sp.]
MFINYALNAQTLGGNSVFNFLRLSNTPQLSALGGINTTPQSNDIGMAWHTPSLLRPDMHTQVNAVFNILPGDIKSYHLMAGYHARDWGTSFALGVQYLNYGEIPATDAAGNTMGQLRPSDYVVQLSASRAYGERWYYGASLKFIQSSYGEYRASGLALDASLSYQDTAALLQVSLVLKNMGAQLKAYAGTQKTELPFDIQAGISKKLANAPLQFSITAHHLHQFDILYEDSSFNQVSGLEPATKTGNKFPEQLFRHVVLGVQAWLTDKVELSAGYNHLRRKELNIGNAGNGLNGFSLGVGLLFKKIQLRYARSHYQRQLTYNQVGLSFAMTGNGHDRQ